MFKKKILILSLVLFSVLLLEGRRRKVIPRFNPVKLLAQAKDKAPTSSPDGGSERLLGAQAPIEPQAPMEQAPAVEPEEPVEPPIPEEPLVPEEPPVPESEPKDIFLNFENADLKTFVNYIGELKKINLLVDPKIAGNKISVTVRDPLTTEGAWNIFLTILEMANFSIVKAGKIHKIIPKQNKLTEPLPVFIDTPSEKLPDSDLTIRYLTFLTNIPIDQVQPLLQSMLSDKSKIITHANSNAFVITDKSYNIKAAMKVIHELDRTDVKQSVTVMRLKHANADDVKKLFGSLMQKPEGHPLARLLGRAPEKSVEYFPPTTKIISEPRTNSLILLGDQKSIKKIEDFIVNHVDTELKGIKSPIHIYELKYADVDQIKDILENLIASESDTPAGKHGGIRGGVKYFKKMKFEMDKKNNRLLVSSTDEQDWKLLKKTIKDLDKPQPQVALETLIVSVQFDENKEIGGQIRNKKNGQIGRNVNAQSANITNIITKTEGSGDSAVTTLLGDLMQNMVASLGSTILTFGKMGNVWSMIRLLQSQTNVTVLSKPFILTTNMKEAKILVGEKRRVSYQQAIGDDQGTLGDTYGYQDAKADLEVKVKPHINLDGVITMNINVDIVEFTAKETTKPDTTEKHLETRVSIADGQVLVLGGFVKTKVLENTYRAPLLSNIPILGWLCKGKGRSVTKEYIFIFMSPTIVKPRTLPGTNLYTKMKLYQSKQDVEDAIEVRKTKDPIHNWFFNPTGETYSHKIVDYANARYQPTSVDIIRDPYYRATPLIEDKRKEQAEEKEEEKFPPEFPEKIEEPITIKKPKIVAEEEKEDDDDENDGEDYEGESEPEIEEEIEEAQEVVEKKEVNREKLRELFSAGKEMNTPTFQNKETSFEEKRKQLRKLLSQGQKVTPKKQVLKKQMRQLLR